MADRRYGKRKIESTDAGRSGRDRPQRTQKQQEEHQIALFNKLNGLKDNTLQPAQEEITQEDVDNVQRNPNRYDQSYRDYILNGKQIMDEQNVMYDAKFAMLDGMQDLLDHENLRNVPSGQALLQQIQNLNADKLQAMTLDEVEATQGQIQETEKAFPE